MSKNKFTINFRSNRNAIAESLSRFRSEKFHDKREERGGSKNEMKDLLEENLFDHEEYDFENTEVSATVKDRKNENE